MKTKPVQKKALTKNPQPQNPTYDFIYIREHTINMRIFIACLFALGTLPLIFILPDNLHVLRVILGAIFIVGVLMSFFLPFPSSKGRGILCEEHVELDLHGKKYTIDYQKIIYARLDIERNIGLCCHIISEGNPSITIYAYTSYSLLFKDKMYKYSTRPITMFGEALGKKVKQKKAVNAKPKARKQ